MRRSFVAAALLFSLVGMAVASERRENDLARIQTASLVLRQIMDAPDSGIPDSIMSGAKCIAIMPSMLKGGFIFGANYGKGVATCRTGKGWSAPAFFKLTGGSFGFQAGGQASDLVLIIRTDDGMQNLLQSKFKLGADASAAAGPVGRDAQAATDLTMRAQVLTYSRARGLFLGVSLGGGVINQDDADTKAFYGKDYTYRSVLNGEVPVPTDAKVLVQTVEKYAPTPRAHVTPTATSAPKTTAPVQPTEAATPSTTASEAREPSTTASEGREEETRTEPSTAAEQPTEPSNANPPAAAAPAVPVSSSTPPAAADEPAPATTAARAGGER
jgi:lipid-binding SYLF domain-containing protein